MKADKFGAPIECTSLCLCASVVIDQTVGAKRVGLTRLPVSLRNACCKRSDVVVWSNTVNRRYWFDLPGRHGWRARYLKEVDAQERTVRFWQEIYDDQGSLVDVHEKYPVDKGHQKV